MRHMVIASVVLALGWSAPACGDGSGQSAGSGGSSSSSGSSGCDHYCALAFGGTVDQATIDCGAKSLFDDGFKPLKCDAEPTNPSSCMDCIEAMGATDSACERAYEACW